MGLFSQLVDDALNRGRELLDAALTPTVASPTPLQLNPTLRVAPNPASGDREPIVRSATFNANGTATVTLDPVDPATSWLIDYLTVSTTSPASTVATIYDTFVDTGHILDGTTNGNSAVAFYAPPRKLVATRQLIAVWAGGTPGTSATLRCEYHVESS